MVVATFQGAAQAGMTLQEFSRDVVPILSLIVGFLGLVSIGLLWYQIRLATKWNKLQGQEKFLHRDLEEVEVKMKAKLRQLGCHYEKAMQPLDDAQARKIWDDPETYSLVKSYLNSFEDLAAAVRIGFADKDFSYSLEGSRLVWAWTVFRPFIELLRTETDQRSFYIELENVAHDWKVKGEEEDRELAREARKLRARQGIVAPKV